MTVFYWNRFFLLPFILLLAFGILWPLASLLLPTLFADANGIPLANFSFTQLTPGLESAFWNTIIAGSISASITVVLAMILAYALCCARIAGRAWIKTLYMAQLFAPAIMPAMGLIYLFGSKGLILNLDIYGIRGIIIGFVILALPACTLQMEMVLGSLDSSQIDAAKILGANAWRRFASIVLPHCRKGLARAFSVAFVLSITDFGVPAVLGGNYNLLATEIYKQAIGQNNFGMAAFASLLLLVPTLAAIAFEWCVRQPIVNSNTARTRFMPSPHKIRDVFFSIFAWLITGFVLLTLGIVAWGSFIVFWPYNLSFSLANYNLADSAYGISPYINSIILALGVSITGTVIVYVGALLVQRSPCVPVLSALYRVLAFIPLCLPGTILGLAYIIAFGGWDFFRGASGGFLLLILNTVVHLYPVPHLACISRLEQIDPRYEVVGRTLGVSSLTTFWRVILSLSSGAIAESASYFFISSLNTISAVIFLYNPDTLLASICALQLLEGGKLSAGSALAVLLLALSCIGRLLLLTFLRSRSTQ